MTAIRFIWKCGLGKFYPQPISLSEIQLSSVLSSWIYKKSNKKSTIYRCLDTWVNNISFRPETSYFKSPIATEHYPLLFQLYQADWLQLRFTKEDQYHEEVTQLLNNLSCFLDMRFVFALGILIFLSPDGKVSSFVFQEPYCTVISHHPYACLRPAFCLVEMAPSFMCNPFIITHIYWKTVTLVLHPR